MTKEEVLQKVNDYCTEKQYTTATLSDAFRNKFADHFFKANEAADIADEVVVNNLKFALNTAFSSASDLATIKQTEFATKESDLQRQIEELKKQQQQTPPPTPPSISPELQQQLDELKRYKDEKTKKEKLANIVSLAKANIRADLHSSFDELVSDYDVALDKDDKAQADALWNKFQAINKASIGDIRPKQPTVSADDEKEFIASIPKVVIKK